MIINVLSNTYYLSTIVMSMNSSSRLKKELELLYKQETNQNCFDCGKGII